MPAFEPAEHWYGMDETNGLRRCGYLGCTAPTHRVLGVLWADREAGRNRIRTTLIPTCEQHRKAALEAFAHQSSLADFDYDILKPSEVQAWHNRIAQTVETAVRSAKARKN